MKHEPDAEPVGFNALRLLELGVDGRVVVTDSLSYVDERVSIADVVVGASFAGAATLVTPLARGAKGVIAHDAGIGKDAAGISGLSLADRHGVPAAAVAGHTASLSNGNSLFEGVISSANKRARDFGVMPGQTAEEAARLLSKAPPGRAVDVSRDIDFTMTAMHSTERGRAYAVWTLYNLPGTYPNDVFALATHSARVAAEHAFRWNVKAWIANDAGMGKNGTGVAGLPICAEKKMPAAAVSAMSARIGDAMSTFNDGVISAANDPALVKGVVIGMRARDALLRMLE